jgi:hypothetical protein
VRTKARLWEYCIAVPAAVAAAVAPVVGFCLAFWRSAPVRDAVARVDLISPYALMSLAAALALTSLALAILRRSRQPQSGARARETQGLILELPATGFLLAASAVIFFLPLLHLWASALSVYSSIGGLLPFSDAYSYYLGAQRLLVEGRLDEWNSRRPLNALLLTVRLALTGGDLRGAMLIDAAMLGASCCLMAREVARDCGAAAGFMLFAALYLISREHVRVVGSESLGLTLATLASTLLWRGSRDGRRSIALLGLTMLTLALNARAGAFLTLPALIIWAGWAFRGSQRRYEWRSGAAAAGAVLAGFGLNALLLEMYAGHFGLGHDNFALTLYGLTTGQPDWTRLYADFPASKQMEGGELAHFAYAHAWQNLRDRPIDLLGALATGMRWWRLAFSAYIREVLSLVPGDSRLNDAFQAAIAIGVVCWLWLAKKERSTWMVLSAAAGLMLSAPVVFPDGTFRALVVSYPLFFLIAALAATAWQHRAEALASSPRVERGCIWPAAALSMTLVVAGFVGPAIAHALSPFQPVDPVTAPDSREVLVVWVGPGTPRLDILAPDSTESSFAPRIRDDDFARDMSQWPEHLVAADPSGRLHGPVTIMLAYDLQRDRLEMYWIIGPPAMRTDTWRTLQLIGQVRKDEWFHYFFVCAYATLPTPADEGNE